MDLHACQCMQLHMHTSLFFHEGYDEGYTSSYLFLVDNTGFIWNRVERRKLLGQGDGTKNSQSAWTTYW